MTLPDQVDMIRKPYLLFVADQSDPVFAKTAFGLHGGFRSDIDLIVIKRFVCEYKADPRRPFIWNALPDTMIVAEKAFQTLDLLY